MTVNNATTQVYSLLADIVSYPQPDLETAVSECAELLAGRNPEAARELKRFLRQIEDLPPGRVEELYTSTFDINPVCAPYIGYHLFGDNHKRGEFLVRLKKDYGVYDFSVEGELPDHLAVMLQFLALLEDEQTARSLMGECLVPALDKMQGDSDRTTSPYLGVIRAILMVLRKELEKDLPGGPQNV